LVILNIYLFILKINLNSYGFDDTYWFLQHSTQSLVSGEISAELDSHACKMYVLTPKKI
jgi:hypothetical protein